MNTVKGNLDDKTDAATWEAVSDALRAEVVQSQRRVMQDALYAKVRIGVSDLVQQEVYGVLFSEFFKNWF